MISYLVLHFLLKLGVRNHYHIGFLKVEMIGYIEEFNLYLYTTINYYYQSMIPREVMNYPNLTYQNVYNFCQNLNL